MLFVSFFPFSFIFFSFPFIFFFLLSSPCYSSDSKLCLSGVCVTAFPGALAPPPRHLGLPEAAGGRGGRGELGAAAP